MGTPILLAQGRRFSFLNLVLKRVTPLRSRYCFPMNQITPVLFWLFIHMFIDSVKAGIYEDLI